ncbi:HAD family hydrolase [Desulfurivibrio alkaliphilus]|uniref:HAD-superfamily hydrolase, subfamily IA, variant 3 n=1 Tax=Desulfurivibrio alkaliphilus (strain DSM 19089 / UNIQEM U267 / AHT2) TaxID=589865 RepID=D6Z557_DESAT|nr:HAD family hydrolase [Desulfurivibrio alkaliphilus]ADH86682.1 HAD-superfamily hydrolase, subfamily IA, variant 3 [Desulfurivibrio alkaliphilus AHT 2]
MSRITPQIDWQAIGTVLLDLDGTLLDRHFDDYFWHCYVPENYALIHNLDIDEARRRLVAKFDQLQGTLAWADLDHWSQELGMDIPALKRRVDALIAVHPHVVEFLLFCRRLKKQIYLVTNAHHKTLAIKLGKTSLAGYWDQVVCAEEIGLAKEETDFWPRLERSLNYDKERTMLVDDTERVLDAANTHGLGQLIHVARASSRAPRIYSRKYPSIIYFSELIPSHRQAQN